MSESSFPGEEEIRSQIFSECRALEFTARKLADARISGAYRSIQKGSGVEFEEARLYTPGDDARRIDWKVSARKQQPYVKSFREDRDQSLVILADISPSSLLGTREPKIRKIGEICAFLSSIAVFNKDAVGGITFYDDVIEYAPPKKGFSATLRLLHAIYKTAYELKAHPGLATPASLHTTLVSAASILKKKSVVFIVSDFNFAPDFSTSLQVLSRKHDVYAIRLFDSLETDLPASGIFSLMNPETKQTFRIDFSSATSRAAFLNHVSEHSRALQGIFNRCGVPFVSFSSTDPVRSGLFNFFQERSRIHAR
jgi:uncharacterized protein (DUF58 family)